MSYMIEVEEGFSDYYCKQFINPFYTPHEGVLILKKHLQIASAFILGSGGWIRTADLTGMNRLL